MLGKEEKTGEPPEPESCPHHASDGDEGDCTHDKEQFPPKLSKVARGVLIASGIAMVWASLYIIDQFCGAYFQKSICCTYVAFGIVLASLLIDRILRHKLFTHEARREDISEVEAMFVEVDMVEPRLSEPMTPPDYEEKKGQLLAEVNRLKLLGREGWTEYQVLSLDQLLVEFLDVDELKARARLRLADLAEYAQDTAYRYEWGEYYDRKVQIDDAIEDIEKYDRPDNSNVNYDVRRDDIAERLRAELCALLDHVADYHKNWAKGTVILRGIMTVGVAAIPILLAMGLLPRLYPDFWDRGPQTLGILNWGLLGIVGALTAVLLSLRRSNEVEVGDTQGKKELWNTVLGTGLGLVAGVLGFAMISGGILTQGSVVPNVESAALKDIGLSVMWAIASGAFFENIFDRMRAATVGSTR